jgi:hypothetical protein
MVGVRGLLAASFMSLVAASCIYDPDQRCGPQQHLGPNSTCACDDGLVLQSATQTCVACGEHETWQAGFCACDDGFTRSEANGGACLPGGPGTKCDPTQGGADCIDAAYDTCRDRGGGIGYCTATCKTDVDCPHSFVCDIASSPATCMSEATGQGDSCTTDADCAGNDASYCETAVVNKCLVVGCSVKNPLSCSEGFSCCDVTPLGLALTLCVPEGDCPTDP